MDGCCVAAEIRGSLLHADKRYRPSLASDLMEPARPAADAVAVALGRESVG
jgi:CRISPR/Cas system-associated endonuclease Cas1